MPARRNRFATLAALSAWVLATPLLVAQEPTAAALIAGLKAATPAGGVYARMRLVHTVPGADKPETLQVQVRRRLSAAGRTEHLYQLLFPASRKGEGLLLSVADGEFTGTAYSPVTGLQSLTPADRARGLFGTALCLDDVLAEFLDWPSPRLRGSELLGKIPCQVVECTAPASSRAMGRRVLCWIDSKRGVAQKIEVYGRADGPLRTVLTEKVLRGKSGYHLPVTFTVIDHATGARTAVEGLRSDSGLTFPDSVFTPEALPNLTVTP